MNRWGLLVSIVVILLAALWSGIFSINKSNKNSTQQYGIGGGPGINTQNLTDNITLDESLKLNTLFQEHAITSTFHLQNIYDGKDTTESRKRVDENSMKISDFFAKEVGGNLKDEFLGMWDGHIKEYENYTKSLKNNDIDGTAQARAKLSEHSLEMASALNKQIPELSTDQAANLMNEHIDLTLGIIEAHARGDSATQTTLTAKASTQAVGFANAIIDAIEDSH